MRIYLAQPMTGRTWAELYSEAYARRQTLAYLGVEVLDPVLTEVDEVYGGIVPGGTCGQNVQDTSFSLRRHWQRDKRMIRRAHVVFDMAPLSKSEGVAHEIGLARFAYWKPVGRIYPEGKIPRQSIARLENDLIADSISLAVHEAKRRWGTWPKRLWWRLRMYARSAPKHYVYKLGFWFQ